MHGQEQVLTQTMATNIANNNNNNRQVKRSTGEVSVSKVEGAKVKEKIGVNNKFPHRLIVIVWVMTTHERAPKLCAPKLSFLCRCVTSLQFASVLS